MNRRPSSFRSLAAAADSATSAADMSYRPIFRGERPQYRRGYSNRPASGDHVEFVSGDSHFSAVSDANRGFRSSYNAVPPPPQYATAQQFYGPGPRSQQHYGPRPYNHARHLAPAFRNYQQAGPARGPQQFRPRASKPPDYREWEYAKQGVPPHTERFTVLSYNILADYLANDHWRELYSHIPHYIMDWNWRKKNIIFELGLWSADILCFQEVDRFQDIEAELKPRGYSGIWKMRTGSPADGCAIFWRVSRFKLLHEESIEYNKFGLRDNVAQICVFESLIGQNTSNAVPTLSTSSASSNRVVVCNIHVLFNPKRGDVKLGQIRVLLDRAHAVSKLWDDAPLVICGDFNCTPKSPLYNFITEQKLDLSELPRDKVSGQASAEIRPPKPAYPGFRPQTGSAVNFEEVEQQGDLPLDAQKLAGLHISKDAPSALNHSKPGHSVLDETSESCISGEHRSRRANDLPSHDTADSCAIKNMATPCVPRDVFTRNLSSARDDIESPNFPERGTNEISELESSSENIYSEATEAGEYVESNSQTSSETPAANGNNTETSIESASCISRSFDFTLDEKFEVLSLDESVDGAKDELIEDSDSFLSELHSASAGQSSFPTDGDSSSPNQKLLSYGDEILNPNFSPGPSAWTPAEIETATGSTECKVMEHPLKLKSAYAEVESSSGLRDSSGEPLVTSYSRRFLGTVDYIWHSEGLQTVRVLAPIPKQVMQQTPGFPTKKWGSDHIALVSNFAFTKDISNHQSSSE